MHEGEGELNPKTEGASTTLAALLVLFFAMWDPRISVVVAVVVLAALGAYRLLQKSE